MREGWICPRCKRVNAPFTPYCDCQENKGVGESYLQHNHIPYIQVKKKKHSQIEHK